MIPYLQILVNKCSQMFFINSNDNVIYICNTIWFKTTQSTKCFVFRVFQYCFLPVVMSTKQALNKVNWIVLKLLSFVQHPSFVAVTILTDKVVCILVPFCLEFIIIFTIFRKQVAVWEACCLSNMWIRVFSNFELLLPGNGFKGR